MDSCANCSRSDAPRLIAGYCDRCDKYLKRTGHLPPVKPLRAAKGESWQLPVRFALASRPDMEAAAEAAGARSVGDWIRSLVETAISTRTRSE